MGSRIGLTLKFYVGMGITDPISIDNLVPQFLSKTEIYFSTIESSQLVKDVLHSFVKDSSGVSHLEPSFFQFYRLLKYTGEQQFILSIIQDRFVSKDSSLKEDSWGLIEEHIELAGCILGRLGVDVVQTLLQHTVPELVSHLTEYHQGHTLAHIVILATVFAGIPSILHNPNHKHYHPIQRTLSQFSELFLQIQNFSIENPKPGICGFVKAMETYFALLQIQ